MFILYLPSLPLLKGMAFGKKKRGILSLRECPLMTHVHMHCEAFVKHPIMQPVMVQNNADHCQINMQTPFS